MRDDWLLGNINKGKRKSLFIAVTQETLHRIAKIYILLQQYDGCRALSGLQCSCNKHTKNVAQNDQGLITR